MEKGDTIPLDALSEEPFDCGYSPIDSAKSVLHIFEKDDATEISLDDISVNEKLFSPETINGDGVLPAEAVEDEFVCGVVKDMVSCTGGSDDISGVKGIDRKQVAEFFDDLRAIKEWKESAQVDAPGIFFLNEKTDLAASSYMKVRDKIDEYFLRCSIDLYNNDVSVALKKKEEDVLTSAESVEEAPLSSLPLAEPAPGKTLVFGSGINPAWQEEIDSFVENPISIKEAFWSPYKKLARMIQERLAKSASAAENSVTAKMSSAVDNPSSISVGNDSQSGATASSAVKKFDVGTIAAISVAFTGIATVVGGLLSAFFGLGYWIPLGIVGIVLAISLPSMFIAWSKLRQRNIAPILDASGWAVNGNVKINIPLGTSLTHVGVRPKGSVFTSRDPYEQKRFPIKRIIFGCILILLIVWAAFAVIKNPNGVTGVIENIKNFFIGLAGKFKIAGK